MKTKRHERILHALAETGTLSVEEAVNRLQTSPATIRRDFHQLAAENLVERVRGGIRLTDHDQTLPFAIREVRHATEKLAIARRAAGMFRDGDVVFVDGGTTTLQLGSCLPSRPLRLITNSIRLAAALETRAPNRARVEIFLTGGFLFPNSGLLVGPNAQSSLAQYHAHWALLSASGIREDGLFNDNEHVVESERVMIAHADRVAVLADHSKIGKHAMCHICHLDKIDVLITDRHSDSANAVQQFAAAGIEVLVV